MDSHYSYLFLLLSPVSPDSFLWLHSLILTRTLALNLYLSLSAVCLISSLALSPISFLSLSRPIKTGSVSSIKRVQTDTTYFIKFEIKDAHCLVLHRATWAEDNFCLSTNKVLIMYLCVKAVVGPVDQLLVLHVSNHSHFTLNIFSRSTISGCFFLGSFVPGVGFYPK